VRGGSRKCSARRPGSYYKYEGVSPAGSHKPNTAVPQAYYNQQAGIKRITTETGAGQWGCSMAFAGQMFGLEVRVYMVNGSATSRSPSAAR
jgi:tryptophan synthase beta chain